MEDKQLSTNFKEQQVRLKIDNIKYYDKNNKHHTDSAISKLAKSIQKRGLVHLPIVNKDGLLIAGHRRVSALRKLGFEEIDVRMWSDLTEAQEKAWRIELNKSPEDSKIDKSVLKDELFSIKELEEDFDLEDTGIDLSEIEKLMTNNVKLDMKDHELDEAEEVEGNLGHIRVTCPSCGHTFKKKSK